MRDLLLEGLFWFLTTIAVAGWSLILGAKIGRIMVRRRERLIQTAFDVYNDTARQLEENHVRVLARQAIDDGRREFAYWPVTAAITYPRVREIAREVDAETTAAREAEQVDAEWADLSERHTRNNTRRDES